jgi:hypothetical protein
MKGPANKSIQPEDLHLVWDSLLYLVGEADIFHASVLERLHIIETTLKGSGGDAHQLSNAINRRAETSGLAKGLLLLNQVLSNPDRRYLLSELQESQNSILKKLQDLRKTFATQEEKITAPSQSECDELVAMTNPVRVAIDDHYDILRSTIYTLVNDSLANELSEDNDRDARHYYDELVSLNERRNFRHEATGMLYEDWISYIENKITPEDQEEIKEIDLDEVGEKYSVMSSEQEDISDDMMPEHPDHSRPEPESTSLKGAEDFMVRLSEEDDDEPRHVNRGDMADVYLNAPSGTDSNRAGQGIHDALTELSGKVVMLDRDLSKTLNDINVRLDMITFGAKEKKITTIYRNESEVLEKLDSTEKKLEDRQKRIEKKLEEYNAELELRIKRANRQFDKQISDVVKSEVELTQKIHNLEELIKAGVPDSEQQKLLHTSERRFSLIENHLNQLEKNFTIFKNLLEAKYNQRIEQTEQKYTKLRDMLTEDVAHIKEQLVESIRLAETRNVEIDEQISEKLDEIKALFGSRKQG